jgi:D-xylose 1-dehydrogenase (NADP+, D-xylono-1,5-lactone-forming)
VTAVKWGILSTARINRAVIPPAHASEKVELVAVASREQARADAYAVEWEIPRAYGSYEALLADDEIEAVYISLPNNLHTEWSIRCVEAGKHVLCEKPMSKRAADVEAAFDAAERADRILSEAFMYRHNPQAKRLRQLLDEEAIGELRVVRACFSFALFDPENIRLRPDVEGGSLMDVGCYCVNGSRLIAGEPELVFGQQLIGPSGTDWVFTGSMRFPGDVFGLFDCGTSLPSRDELEAIGSEGVIFLDDPWHARIPVIELRRRGETELIETDPADSYLLELENVSDAIRGEGELLLGREDAVDSARAIEALATSAESGEPVRL